MTTSKDILVIYHHPCSDGFGAAYAAWKHLGDTADYRPHSYDMPPPKDIIGKTIYVVDFSFKTKQLTEICSKALEVTVIDHHKDAAKDLQDCAAAIDNLTVVFDNNKSGCGLTWEYFFAAEPPELLKYIQDRDLWEFKKVETKEILLALDVCYETLFPIWDTLVTDPGKLKELYQKGKILIQARKKSVRQLAEGYHKVKLGGITGYACNATYSYASDLGNYLARREQTFGLVYYFDGKTSLWKYSLRSIKGGVDVSKIARTFGGNGHVSAAGFTLPYLLEELK